MSDLVRIHIKGMTCAHCETSVASALEEAGASEVQVDHRRAQAVFTVPMADDLAPYRKALSRAGYQSTAEEVLPAEPHPVPVEAGPAQGRESWIGTLALFALPALCCGLPLLIIALISTGAGAWLFTHGSLLAVPALGLAAGLLVWRGTKRRSS